MKVPKRKTTQPMVDNAEELMWRVNHLLCESIIVITDPVVRATLIDAYNLAADSWEVATGRCWVTRFPEGWTAATAYYDKVEAEWKREQEEREDREWCERYGVVPNARA